MGSQSVYYTGPGQIPTQPPNHDENLFSYSHQSRKHVFQYLSPQPDDYPTSYAHSQYSQHQPSYAPLYSSHQVIADELPIEPSSFQPQPCSYRPLPRMPNRIVSAPVYRQEMTAGFKRRGTVQTSEPTKRQKSKPVQASLAAIDHIMEGASALPSAPSAARSQDRLPVIIDLTCSQEDLPPTPPKPLGTASSPMPLQEHRQNLPSLRAPVIPRCNRSMGQLHRESLSAVKDFLRAAAEELAPLKENIALLTPARQPKSGNDKITQKVSKGPHSSSTTSHAMSKQQHVEGLAAAKALSRGAAVGRCITPSTVPVGSRSAIKAKPAATGPIMLDANGHFTTDPDEARTFLPRPLPTPPESSPATPTPSHIWNAPSDPPSSKKYLPNDRTPPAPTSSYMPLSSQDSDSAQLSVSSPSQAFCSYGISNATSQADWAKGARRRNPVAGPAPTNNDEPEPRLCAEQEALVELICTGKNVFYTGSAGCGKSTVLKAFTRRLRAMGKKVQVVAPTGRAALQVNGQTTWTFAGWRPEHNRLPLDKLLMLAHGKRTWRRLTNIDVLVIDEISMVENSHFARLNAFLKEARYQPHGPELPFGGLQVIVTGDFCQLPPVTPFEHCFYCGAQLVKRRKPYGQVYTCKKHGEFRDEDKWAFRSQAWEECNFVHVQLTQIHRQSDALFVGLLQKCRLGLEFTPEETDILMNHPDKVNRINATQLHATRDTVREVNAERFARLKTECHTFWSLDAVSLREYDPHLAAKGRVIEDFRWNGMSPPRGKQPLVGLADHRYEACVQLKQGMLVVLLTNLDLESGLCNGSQGLIAGWEQYEPAKPPSPGMKFVGDHAYTREDQVTKFIQDDAMEVKAWPRVRFLNGVVRTIYADCSITEIGERDPYSLLMRTQIPLAPAWAMTIHKSQGMTLNQVIVYLSRAWEEGQVYVALSRATSLDGLKIDGSAAGLTVGVGGNREVQRFMREKFGAHVSALEGRPAGQEAAPPPPASQPKFFYDFGPNSRAILPER